MLDILCCYVPRKQASSVFLFSLVDEILPHPHVFRFQRLPKNDASKLECLGIEAITQMRVDERLVLASRRQRSIEAAHEPRSVGGLEP